MISVPEQENLYDLTRSELENWLRRQLSEDAIGIGSGVVDAVWRWLYDDNADASLYSDLPISLGDILPLEGHLRPHLLASSESTDGNTRKDLVEMTDGERIETVLLRYRHRYTVCVSTQVGCACGCTFCATGQMGFVRQLSAGEIIAQVMHFRHVLQRRDLEVSNVVLMGMGEPLLNEQETLEAVERFVDPRALGIAPRHVTLSTSGIAPGIIRLADLHHRLPIKLAVSLHAATDELRNQLMPINRTYPLAELFEALQYYTRKTQRRLFLEWTMIDGVNDSVAQAHTLAARLADLPAHVNLMYLNETRYEAAPASVEAIDTFAAVLDEYEIPHTVRQRRGAGIDAACGQLRTRVVDSASTTT